MTRISAIQEARDVLTIRRVYGEPIERDGVTIIPAAAVMGGGGGGVGASEDGEGEGGGFGVHARPVGAFVLRGDTVTWHPTMDVTRVVVGAQVVGVVALLVLRSIVRSRAKRRH